MGYSAMDAIEVDDIRKIYRAGKAEPVRALDGVSFKVPQGAIFGLLGPNGAGKSTLVKVLSTITAPTSGRAAVLGRDVAAQPLEARRRMAVVLQQAAADTLLTVEDNLLIYAYLHGMDRAEARKRLKAIVEEFDLGEKLKETVMDLSIGTKRRVQVAKVFMLDMPLIILDEATTGMDPLMKRRVMDRLRAEARRWRTVLLTTQVLSEAEQLCDTIMIINKGRALASGTLQDLRRLSERMFRVSLSFEDMAGDLKARLAALGAEELKAEGKTVELLVRGDQSTFLVKLAEVARTTPIAQYEVRGPDLEEIFVTLLKDQK
jgi:ABC-2 type transport system ATP-binding protein